VALRSDFGCLWMHNTTVKLSVSLCVFVHRFISVTRLVLVVLFFLMKFVTAADFGYLLRWHAGKIDSILG
jgi:hypothetical protein